MFFKNNALPSKKSYKSPQVCNCHIEQLNIFGPITRKFSFANSMNTSKKILPLKYWLAKPRLILPSFKRCYKKYTKEKT